MSIIYNIEKTEFLNKILKLTYKDTVIEFDVDLVAKEIDDVLFQTINKYLSKLDDETNELMFNAIYEFYVMKSKNVDLNSLESVRYIEDLVANIVKVFNLARFKDWLNWNTDEINFPVNIKDEFVYDPDLSVTKEKTYTKREYQDLVANIHVIRMLLPILSEYYNSIQETVKYSFFKTFLLLVKSDVYESEEMQKLRIYILEIQASLTTQGNSKFDGYVLLKSLSTDDVNEYILADIIFTKLLFVDYVSAKSNIVSFIFQTIKFKTNFSAPESEIIRSRTLTGDPKKEEQSYFEDYRKTSDVSLGTIVEVQHFLNDIDMIIRELKLEEYFNYEQYNEELNYSFKLSKTRFNKTQIFLLGWFLHKYINPRALFYIENKKVIELLTLANIVLWNSGNRFLATLLTSSVNEDSNYVNSILKYSINKDDLAKIQPYYTFSIDKEKNVIENTILEVAKEINNYIWTPNTTIEKRNTYNNSQTTNNLIIPMNLVSQLCDYVQFVNR